MNDRKKFGNGAANANWINSIDSGSGLNLTTFLQGIITTIGQSKRFLIVLSNVKESTF